MKRCTQCGQTLPHKDKTACDWVIERRREENLPPPPASFLAMAEERKCERIRQLEELLAAERAASPIAYYRALDFQKGDREFARAALVAAHLGHAAHETVTFRPYDTKFVGAWRIEAGHYEWYVTEELLFATWERVGQLLGGGS